MSLGCAYTFHVLCENVDMKADAVFCIKKSWKTPEIKVVRWHATQRREEHVPYELYDGVWCMKHY